MATSAKGPYSAPPLASWFDTMLDRLGAGTTTPALNAAVRHATWAIPGVDHAGISVMSARGEPRTCFASDDLAMRADALQCRIGEGPSLAALTQSDLVLVADLVSDQQFPRFSPRAVELGLRSMLSTRLRALRDHRAALTLYAHRPAAFREEDLALAAIYASFASVLLLNRLQERDVAGLRRAVETNREIGVAVGILMARSRCTREYAFERLRTASHNLNRRLIDVADEVILTGELPESTRSDGCEAREYRRTSSDRGASGMGGDSARS